MKKFILFIALLIACVFGLQAQDCNAENEIRRQNPTIIDCDNSVINSSNYHNSELDSMLNLSDLDAMINGKLCSCVSAYPNPTRGNFKIRVAYYEGEEESSFVLFDLAGNVKLDLTEKLKDARREKLSFVEIDGTSFVSGVYLARLNKGNAAKTTKIFVVR